MLLGALLAGAVAAVPPLDIAHLRPIPVHEGVNAVAHLSADGRDGIIVSGFHNASPSADGNSRDYLVLLSRDGGQEVVSAEPTPSLVSDTPFGGELLSAAPHDGEAWKRVIRFAHAEVNGAPSTLMILAERDMRKAQDPYAGEPVRITYFQLQRDKDFDDDRFMPLGTRWSRRCYGDANLALKDELGLPLPPDYAGPKASEACRSR
jgi:hypothetical protein